MWEEEVETPDDDPNDIDPEDDEQSDVETPGVASSHRWEEEVETPDDDPNDTEPEDDQRSDVETPDAASSNSNIVRPTQKRKPFNAFGGESKGEEASNADWKKRKYEPRRRSNVTEVWNDWNCPNMSCKNHRTKVFGKYDKCKMCGSARPSWLKPVALAPMMNEVEEEEKFFEFPLVKVEDGLGVEFKRCEDEVLIITKIVEGGPVDRMNLVMQAESDAERAIVYGDVVVAVNDIEGDCDEMLKEWREQSDLTLHVHRHRSVVLELLKDVQNTNWPAAVNAWNDFCDNEGSGNRFPSAHDSDFIRRFLLEVWPVTPKSKKSAATRRARARHAERYWAERGGEYQRNLDERRRDKDYSEKYWEDDYSEKYGEQTVRHHAGRRRRR